MDGLAGLERRAAGGDADAQYKLAASRARAGDAEGAQLWLERAAASGHPGALYTKATQLLSSAPATQPEAAARLLERAAAKGGDAAARLLGVLKTLGLGTAKDRAGALALVSEAAARGRPEAQRELAALAAINAGASAAPAETLHADRPRIIHLKAALTPVECAYVIAAARPHLQKSAVADPDMAAARHAAFRTSDGAVVGLLALDLALIAIWEKLARAVGRDLAQSELPGVLRYRPGEEYRPHHDFLPEDARDYSEVRRAGQRDATLLVPLNAAFSGGETVFPRLGVSFRGEAGDGLYFQNTDEGRPIEASLHAGAAVTAGEKWMLTLWFRERRFWFWE